MALGGANPSDFSVRLPFSAGSRQHHQQAAYQYQSSVCLFHFLPSLFLPSI